MNVLVAANEAYLEPMQVMLYSLATHNRCKINVFVLHFAIPLKSQEKLKKQIAKWGQDIEIIFLKSDESIFNGIVRSERYKNETNLRLLMLEMLPDNIEKILWLDVDIIVKGSLERLYNYPDKGQYAVACEDMFSKSERYDLFAQLGLKSNYKYFNAGVMVFYLENLRRDFANNAFMQWMYEHPDKLKYPDQNVLNVCLKGNVVWADSHVYNLQLLRVGRGAENLQLLSRAKILHYNTKEKPWQKSYTGVGELIYWTYAVRVWGIRKLFLYYMSKNKKV